MNKCFASALICSASLAIRLPAMGRKIIMPEQQPTLLDSAYLPPTPLIQVDPMAPPAPQIDLPAIVNESPEAILE